ncbi:TSL-kinase interacting protein 1 isoform X2 [Silene latifolia]|uniref:TSL-kinase interacting protein 1 isoform X2 n=1 Tax=Silene latifolia TaxID=37657 RepID=UPI003D76AC45
MEENLCLRCNEQNLSDTDGDHDGNSPLIPSSSDNVVSSQPAKRPTRQWAAWTREEEECFFTALRQVGKNFQKITCRVQSKNKDQVRHYYYRLVRRMNKLLGPGLCLDAKNSKDTNAAMLRWWSLLEKYSCKASKLHLKPRRFKIFVEALEHQLLKDKKRNVKKQSSQGENCSAPTSSFPHQNKSSANDLRAVKIIAVDGQNVEKAGNGKGSSTRRSSNLGVTRSSNKGESSPTKSTRQRRKTGVLSAAAVKRWEKEAMAGVSLVADAAEHVERTSGGKQANFLDGLTVLSVQAAGCSMEKNDPGPSGQFQAAEHVELTSGGKEANVLDGLTVLSVKASGCSMEKNDPGPSCQVQANSLIKLKLQLFPIDDNTRRALEMDKHNPHLELTLSARKKISSVLEHIARKWGNSSVASGELMLFPFNIQKENIFAYQRWTRDSVATVTEIHAMIGSPPVFRLRYGWIVASELQPAIPEAPVAFAINSLVDDTIGKEAPVEPTLVLAEKKDEGKHVSYSSDEHLSGENNAIAACGEANAVNVENNLLELANLLSMSKRNGSNSGEIKNLVDQRLKKTPTLSAGEWADSLTNVGVGEVLSVVHDNAIGNNVETPLQSSRPLEEIPFTCDSFDAALAAHISSQYKSSFSRTSPHLSSIWDAEETCDEFTFQKSAVAHKQDPYLSVAASSLAGDNIANTSSANIDHHLAEETMAEDVSEDDQMDECPSEPFEVVNPPKDFSSLTDIYWPESLGPLELDVPSCKYYSEDLILSDSMSGLNRLIASSLDAFHHFPLFGLDDKVPSQAAVPQRGASFSGKIGTGDSPGVRSLQV